MTSAITRYGLQELPRDRHIRHPGDDYTQAFLRLLPQGQAWPRAPDSTLARTCDGLSQYWGWVDGRAADLLEIESDPRKTVELLPDWERAWGLPDPCFPAAVSVEERQRMLVLVMTMLGAQSRKFFEDISAWVGKILDITEYSPFTCAISECGDTRYEYDDTGEYRWYIGPEEQRFYWTISSEDAVLEWFRCGDPTAQSGLHPHCDIFTEAPIDCLLQRWKPAHTEMVFDYSSLQEQGPWAGLP
jgi:uncharacterized protein YmfQ (DUF2313 family)